MANKIILKKSSVASKVPLATDLDIGEIAVNLADQKLYSKNASGTVILVGNSTQGTVTSVTGTSPVSSSGGPTPAISLASGYGDTQNPYASKTANYVLAAPNGSAGAPTFRALAAADIPDLTLDKIPDAWVKKSVRVATTANITLSGTQTIDGISVVAGDRVLVKDQTTQSQNGIYVVAAGAWARSTDADTISELAGSCVNVYSGTTNGGFRFDTDLKSTDTLGTTAVLFYRVYDSNDSATANTANKLVLRDASGNFSAGTITATLSGSASTLTTARTLWGQSFNGSANVTGALSSVTTMSMSGQLTSTLATGTSPFSVTSTTINTNLNADLLDGQHGSYYAPIASPTLTGTPAAPTASVGTNTTQLATTAFVNSEIANDAFLKAAGGSIVETVATISANYSITSGSNGLSAGPISINSGVTVTIPTGSTWAIV